MIAPQTFIPGDLAVLELAAKSDNTSGSIVELNSSTANQASPVETVPSHRDGLQRLGHEQFSLRHERRNAAVLCRLRREYHNTRFRSDHRRQLVKRHGDHYRRQLLRGGQHRHHRRHHSHSRGYDGTFTITAIGTGGNANLTFSYALASDPGAATQFANASATSLTTDLSYDVATGARGVGTLNAGGTFNLPTTYTEIAAGDQTRSATSTDDTNWLITDKQGTYTNGDSGNWIDFNTLNARSFGGVIYISSTSPAAPEQIGPAGDSSGAIPPAAVLTLASPTSILATGLPGIPTDSNIQDFYLIQSGVNGNTYDILYTLDATGVINKFSLTNPGQPDATWVSNGTYTMAGSPGLSMLAENVSGQ